jgi:hypothetical protein
MARTTSLRCLFTTGLVLAALTPAGGCLFGGYDGEFIEAEDVRIELPNQGFRDTEVRGDMWWLINHTANNVNGWVTAVVEVSGYVVEFLNNHRPSSLDGGTRVYGPVDDNGGRNIAWLVRIGGSGTDTHFEFLVAPRGTVDQAGFQPFADGKLVVDDDLRHGHIHIDFDTVEAYPELNTTVLWSFAGDLTIEFERHVSTGEKTIRIDYDEFVAIRTGYLDDDVFSSDESYEYHKAGDGSGSFHLALMGEWDTYPYTWSGPQQERMQLDMVWTPDAAGRAYGTITEVDGVGDMKYGDLSLDECFDGQGVLSYRFLTEAYANEVPGYNFGDPSSCVLDLP